MICNEKYPTIKSNINPLFIHRVNFNNLSTNLKTHKMKNSECYIEFLDCKNKFRKTKKEFISYEDAKKWMLENLEKPNTDFIKFN